MIVFPTHLNEIVLSLSDLGFESFFVGGCVRDALLERETFDIDICTNARMDVLESVFSKYNYEVFEALGALSFRYDVYQIEITRFRKESDYNGRVPLGVSFDCTLEEDIVRRDFTINGLLYHPTTGVVDLVGGLKDLSAGILRCIGDPSIKFNEDYLRMLRVLRFKAQLGFKIEDNTWSHCVANFNKLSTYGLHIWRDEFFKFLVSDRFVDIVADNPWILRVLIKEMDEAFDFDQRNPYHNYSLFHHTIYVIKNLEGLELRLVGLFHDLGKLNTQVIREDGRGSYPGHALAGRKIAQQYLLAWHIPKAKRNWILSLIEFHDMSLSYDYIDYKKEVSKHGLEFMQAITSIKRADNLAKSNLAYYQVDKCFVLQAYNDKIKLENPVLSIRDLDIKGRDLLVDKEQRALVLEALLNLVIEGKIENKFAVLQEESGRISL